MVRANKTLIVGWAGPELLPQSENSPGPHFSPLCNFTRHPAGNNSFVGPGKGLENPTGTWCFALSSLQVVIVYGRVVKLWSLFAVIMEQRVMLCCHLLLFLWMRCYST